MPESTRFDDLRRRWEQRARERKSAPVGVLYQGLSPALNGHVHRFHLECIQRELLARLPHGARLLDLGCGYGRIGALVRETRPDIELVGSDFSFAYCQLHRQNLGAHTVCCDLQSPPFMPASFDAIVSVTVLMYQPLEQRARILAGLLDLLRPGGMAMFIEPAQEVIQMISILRPNAARQTTGGAGFTAAEFKNLGKAYGCETLSSGGMPIFTLLLPLLVALDKLPSLQRAILVATKRMDGWLSAFSRLSLHRWLLVKSPVIEGTR